MSGRTQPCISRRSSTRPGEGDRLRGGAAGGLRVEPICSALGVSVSAYYPRRSRKPSARAPADRQLVVGSPRSSVRARPDRRARSLCELDLLRGGEQRHAAALAEVDPERVTRCGSVGLGAVRFMRPRRAGDARLIGASRRAQPVLSGRRHSRSRATPFPATRIMAYTLTILDDSKRSNATQWPRRGRVAAATASTCSTVCAVRDDVSREAAI